MRCKCCCWSIGGFLCVVLCWVAMGRACAVAMRSLLNLSTSKQFHSKSKVGGFFFRRALHLGRPREPVDHKLRGLHYLGARVVL